MFCTKTIFSQNKYKEYSRLKLLIYIVKSNKNFLKNKKKKQQNYPRNDVKNYDETAKLRWCLL